MGWDSSRPVPWNRLIREWLIYAAIMSAIFLIFFRGDNVVGAIAGVLISGPLYLAFGSVMAKFGYSRTKLKDVRSVAKDRSANSGTASKGSRDSSSDDPELAGPKPRAAPTSRTAGGGNRPKSSGRKKR